MVLHHRLRDKIYAMRKVLVSLSIFMVLSLVVGFFKPIFAQDEVRLVEVLAQHTVSGQIWLNPLGWAIKNAVASGVSVETVTLLLLFPLTAALVAFSRQVLGLSGFGIFTPALVAMAFLITGIPAGLVLFLAIILAATVSRYLISKVKLPYLPRMSILIWAVSLMVLILLLLSPVLGLDRLVKLGIFPVLLYVMLAESYIEAQITRTWQSAALMTGETIGIAMFASIIMGLPAVQEWVLVNPEITVLLILLLDWLIGKYKGLRLMEVWRFRKIIKI